MLGDKVSMTWRKGTTLALPSSSKATFGEVDLRSTMPYNTVETAKRIFFIYGVLCGGGEGVFLLAILPHAWQAITFLVAVAREPPESWPVKDISKQEQITLNQCSQH
jgi:hypothetical protein